MISIIYVTLKCGTNELVYKIATDSDIDNRFAVVKRGSEGGRGIYWEFGVTSYQHLERINNKGLLYSTGN